MLATNPCPQKARSQNYLYILLLVCIAFIFPQESSAQGERQYYYNNQFSITYLGRFVESGSTKFCYTVCAEDVLEGYAFEGLVFEIPQCLPELTITSCEPGNCSMGETIISSISGVNWQSALHSGICQLFSFTIPGDIREDLNLAGIRVEACADSDCEAKSLPGPGCDTPAPTVTPTPTCTPTPTNTPTVVVTPTPVPALPVCDANGPYINLECSDSPVIVQLDGSGSYSSDGSDTFL